VARVLDEHRVNTDDVGSQRDLTVDDVLAADAWARTQTLDHLKDPPP
jgi:hypothetical protein